MGAFIDTASAIISQSEQRVEIAAQNIANVSTPGYKRRVSFASLVGPDPTVATAQPTTVTDFSAGKMIITGNALDLAVLGKGMFAVQTDTGVAYLRGGKFQTDANGRVVTPEGYPLELQGGGDLNTKGAVFQVQSDGAVVENGAPIGKLEVIDFVDPHAVTRDSDGLFRTPDANVVALATPGVRQGALEASNVSTGDEMVTVMEALRRAESGQRLVTIFDDLMGRVLSTFGQA